MHTQIRLLLAGLMLAGMFLAQGCARIHVVPVEQYPFHLIRPPTTRVLPQCPVVVAQKGDLVIEWGDWMVLPRDDDWDQWYRGVTHRHHFGKDGTHSLLARSDYWLSCGGKWMVFRAAGVRTGNNRPIYNFIGITTK